MEYLAGWMSRLGGSEGGSTTQQIRLVSLPTTTLDGLRYDSTKYRNRKRKRKPREGILVAPKKKKAKKQHKPRNVNVLHHITSLFFDVHIILSWCFIFLPLRLLVGKRSVLFSFLLPSFVLGFISLFDGIA
jgi:hypothetical protein